jgi:AraC-like DNA-binding protein
MSDTLSDVLRTVRLTGAVFFDVDATPPWVAEAPPARTIAHAVMPGSDHVIEYHLVTSGECWAGVAGETPIRLRAGDVILFPHGDGHVLSSGLGMRAPPDPLTYIPAPAVPLPVKLYLRGGGEERVRIACGFVGCDARPFNPLLEALPRVIHVAGDRTDDRLRSYMELAMAESSSRSAGSGAMLARLSELVFVEVMRRYVRSLPPEQTGWLAGLRDEFVGRALALMHERPAHPWTLDELAREVYLARSALAERFTRLVGQPPIQYLTGWRMQLAAGMLASGSATVATIASKVGYESEAAFSRAFRKATGVPPATWRRAVRS